MVQDQPRITDAERGLATTSTASTATSAGQGARREPTSDSTRGVDRSSRATDEQRGVNGAPGVEKGDTESRFLQPPKGPDKQPKAITIPQLKKVLDDLKS